MSKILWTSLLVTPALLASALVGSAQAETSNAAAQLQVAETAATNLQAVAPEMAVTAEFSQPAPQVVALTPVEATAPVSVASLDAVSTYANEGAGNAADQVTSVSQLSDVQPTDWAFQALQSLVERYGCIAGYPDGTYRGNRALTRYEFAAGMNACLDRVNELIAAGTADLVRKEDLVALQRLQEEFAAELATLRGRVDALEARTAELEANQFSTTTKLNGEVIFALVDAFGDASTQDYTDDDDNYNTTFGYRARLNFDTSFSGRDRLRTRLQAGNLIDPNTNATSNFSAPSPEGRLGFQLNTANAVNIEQLNYRFPLTQNVRIWLAANGTQFNDMVDVVSPFESSGSGAVSRFGRFNPIYRTGDDKGIVANIGLNSAVGLDVGYLAENANNPADATYIVDSGPNPRGSNAGGGLFSGNYSALAQLRVNLSNAWKLNLAYIHGYRTAGLGHGTGSLESNLAPAVGFTNLTSYNSYGVSTNLALGRGFQIGGWAGFTSARVVTPGQRGDVDIWNYAVTLAFPDLGKEGNLGGIVVGMQPRVAGTSNSQVANAIGLAGLRDDNDDPANPTILRRKNRSTGFHIEGFYRYQLTDNISITPGIVWLTAPGHDDRNGDIVVGTLRTTFTF